MAPAVPIFLIEDNPGYDAPRQLDAETRSPAHQ